MYLQVAASTNFLEATMQVWAVPVKFQWLLNKLSEMLHDKHY